MDGLYDFTEANFKDEVEGYDGVSVVDFWAPWCGPCKMQAPAVGQIAEEYKDASVKVGKVNVDENTALAGKFAVMSIPTVIIFKNGNPVDKTVGVAALQTLKKKIDKALA